jgi:glycosyltransferase involved in cell wall biosynthesis
VAIRLGVLALAKPESGGTYQYTLSMLQALQHTSGFEITLYGNPKNPDLVDLGYPIRPFTGSRAQQLAALTAHKMHIKLTEPFAAQDVLLAATYSLALLHTSKPFAYTLHDVQEIYYPQNFSWAQRVWRYEVHSQLLGRARRVICESHQVKADIAAFFGVLPGQATVMAAPPLRQFLRDESDARLQAARARLNLPDRFLFYPAHFWAHKNHLRLLKAFREVLDEVSDLNLVLTGNKQGEYETVMHAIEKLNLNGSVRHLGYVRQDDIQSIYRLATALVMPSLFESVSIPIYEAFQVGTPVAASGILGIPEQVSDAGVLFDPKSVASIKEAILTIVRNPEAARLLGNRGRERMLQMTPERYGRQLQDLLRQL